MAGFAPYFKPSYGWEPVPSSYKLRQMSFSPTVLQHTSNLYGPHISRSPQPQQPLDCSTHYSPALENYHCIACEKVRATSLFLFVASRPHRSEEEEKKQATRQTPPLTGPADSFFPPVGVLDATRPGGSRPEVAQRDQTFWLQHLQEDLRPRRQPGAAHERPLSGASLEPHGAYGTFTAWRSCFRTSHEAR